MTMTVANVTSIYVPHVGWLDYFKGDDVATFLREGWFEYKQLAFLHLYLRPGDIVIDGGAHAGLYSILAGGILHDTGRVVSIEPVPATAALLRTNLAKNHVTNATILEAALYSSDGNLPLNVMPPGQAAYDSLYATYSPDHEIYVISTTLDTVLERQGIEHVDFLKIDIEGAEVDALAGARSSIEAGKLPLIMIEFTEHNLRSAGSDTAQLRQVIETLGYGLFCFNTETLQLEEFIFNGPVWYDNLFAVRDIDVINERLRTASDMQRQSATDLILRGDAANRLKERDEQQEKSITSLEEAQQRLEMEKVALASNLEETQQRFEKEKAVLAASLEETRQRLEKETITSQERLSLLRRAHLRYQLAERRIDHELLCRWPLRLAFRYRLARPPLWAKLRQREQTNVGDRIESYIAEHPLATELAVNAQQAGSTQPDVSVVLCTYNPRPDLLDWALESIANQSLTHAHYEVVLVDNNSQPEIDLSAYPITRTMPIRQVREERQGLIFARLAGIRASRASLIVFVDDDNYLDPGYLENALAIARAEPELGLFGGVSHGRLEREIPGWKRKLLPYLGVRNDGDEPITSFEAHWGPWEPIGAGMVARREVAEAYVTYVENDPATAGLGRQGNALYSCEDSLFARVANQQSYACSYQPKLNLQHYIQEKRLRSGYLFRLIRDLGRSYVRLEYILGRGEALQPCSLREVIQRLLFQVSGKGISGVFHWAWNLGYRTEVDIIHSDKRRCQ